MDYNAIFEQRLAGLNVEQAQAVQQIDGPVMVVAGPGTGKTELLAMRVANILRQTDIDPANILCLTFTESASANMVERLSRIIGPAAYQVDINTFHGFGSSVIGKYGEYFYRGADYHPASPLTQAEIISNILANLPFDNPLNVVNNDQPIYLGSVQTLIQNFKKSGLSPDQLALIAQQNIDFCAQAQPFINQAFGERINKQSLAKANVLLDQLQAIAEQQPHLDFTSEPKLGALVCLALTDAINQAEEEDKTKPLSEFKKLWLECNTAKEQTLKDEKRSNKILNAIGVYRQYLEQMNQRGLYDFGDMILQVTQAMRQYPDLKANLQEQHQYILVDEFQDTNDAQMALLAELTDYDDQPNLMVVGDDDQAIYRFQGADISNIQSFAKRFAKITQINLSTNYRSGAAILDLSSQVAGGISDRLTNIDGSPKQIIASQFNPTSCDISRITATTAEHEYDYVAQQVKRLIDSKTERPGNIAIIARQHASLENLSYYLAKLDLPISYERQRDIYQSPLIQLLLHLAGAIDSIAVGSRQRTEAHLPYIIADPSFGFSAEDFYHISLQAQQNHGNWLATISSYNDNGAKLVSWLKAQAQAAVTKSLSAMLAGLVGINSTDSEVDDSPDNKVISSADASYRSPIFNYYFSPQQFSDHTLRYLNFLSDYNTLTKALSEFKPDTELKLADLLDFATKSQQLNQPLYSVSAYGNDDGIQLMTAHKAKGMEFSTVFIIDAESEQWGSKKSARGDKLALPTNMSYSTVGDSDDEKRRLFFVAMTRAKQNLYITAHSQNGSKTLNQLEYIMDLLPSQQLDAPEPDIAVQQLATPILAPVLEPRLNRRQLLANKLANYRLSATGLNMFLDLEHGGPEAFLQNNLLRVPQGVSAPMLFGTAIHAVMEKMHNFVKANNQAGQLPPFEEVEQTFVSKFQTNDLTPEQAKQYTDKGKHALRLFYDACADQFKPNQRAELKLEAVLPSGARLTGKLDAVEFDQLHRTIKVVDYKTGKAFDSFAHPGQYRAKAHRYHQQLMFYKLLTEHSAEYHDWRVVGGALEFIEPVEDKIVQAGIDYDDPAAMEEFTVLVNAVWQCIVDLDLPDVSQFAPNLKGTLDFERWLIDNQPTIE